MVALDEGAVHICSGFGELALAEVESAPAIEKQPGRFVRGNQRGIAEPIRQGLHGRGFTPHQPMRGQQIVIKHRGLSLTQRGQWEDLELHFDSEFPLAAVRLLMAPALGGRSGRGVLQHEIELEIVVEPGRRRRGRSKHSPFPATIAARQE